MRKRSGQPNEFGIFVPGEPAPAPAPAPAPEPEDDGFKADARDGDGDGMVQDGTKHERPAPKRTKKRGK